MRINDMRRALYGILLITGILLGDHGISDAAMASPSVPQSDEVASAERAFRDGRVESGLENLKLAVQRGGNGGIRAQLRLARLHSEGKIVPRDEVKACELYGALADSHSQIERTDPAAKLVAEAFRAWAFCYMRGVPGTGFEQDLSRAAALFYQAGVMLDDVDSLYELAKMYLMGQGIQGNPRLAVHFFFSAARRGHAPAQAMLGILMWEGKVLKRQSVNGLALMKLALDVARPDDKSWIDNAYEEALLTATQEEEAAARRLADDWRKAYGPNANGTTPLIVPTPQVAPAPAPAMATNPVPPPVRAPGVQPPAPRQLATPSGGTAKPIEQQNEFNTLPTNMQVPTTASPPAE
jgi:hypothetical protein